MRAALAALVVISAGAHAQTNLDIYAQRALARALDERCQLFTENERLALDGAFLQARGDLLRAGFEAGRIDQSYDQISRNAANQPCDSEATLAVAANIHSAYVGWQRERFQDYVGAPNLWRANRPYGYDSWVVTQTLSDPEHSLMVGLYNSERVYALVIATAVNSDIASLTLHTRNPQMSPELYDPSLGGLLQIDGLPSWTPYLPPATGSQNFIPSNRWSDEDLIYFGFSESALAAFAALDPREASRIEAFDAQGNLVATHYVGIGDFAAALAFVRSSPDWSGGR